MERQVRHLGEKSFTSPDLVVYAGQSARRIFAMQSCLTPQSIPFACVKPGEEPDIPDVTQIAHRKILDVVAAEEASIIDGNIVYIAADTRTSVPQICDGVMVESRNKPKSIESVREHFQRMIEVRNQVGINPFYIIRTGTAAYSAVEEKSLTQEDAARVYLDEKSVRYLASQKGFSEYLHAVHDFYSGQPYASHSLPVVKITDFSAGISLPVLIKMGAVYGINGDVAYSRTFKDTFREALYLAAIGFNFDILRIINSHLASNMRRLQWLDEVVDQAYK
jgi:hypothetical protein